MGKNSIKSPKVKKVGEKPVKLDMSFEDALKLAAKIKPPRKGK
jgi:hypothetical protein